MQKLLSFLICLTLLCATFGCEGCREDTIVNVYGRVVNKTTQNPIKDAKIIYNAGQNLITDMNGEFEVKYNLGRYLADSISLFISKDDLYHSRGYSTIIGNTQKDIFLIELEPK
jgi:hypothetical protein